MILDSVFLAILKIGRISRCFQGFTKHRETIVTASIVWVPPFSSSTVVMAWKGRPGTIFNGRAPLLPRGLDEQLALA